MQSLTSNTREENRLCFFLPILIARDSAQHHLWNITITCGQGSEVDGKIGVRISSIFTILVGSWLGAIFPIFAKRNRAVGVPDWAFFAAKFFGSGVIIATSFMHLLSPASEALTSPCLGGVWAEYDWAEGIALMTIFFLFPIEVLTMRYAKFAEKTADRDEQENSTEASLNIATSSVILKPSSNVSVETHALSQTPALAHGQDQLSTTSNQDRVCEDVEEVLQCEGFSTIQESYAAQLTAIFILEFGVIFHSVFMGLTLAVAAWSDFKILYVVAVFHQTFEGLGLGARLASVPWPASKHRTPYLLASGFGLATPLAIAIGLAMRTTYSGSSPTSLVVNGIFDAISAGILIYTGLVELMAHEFLFNKHMQTAPIKEVAGAFGLMCLGAGVMALLGKWS